jgi:hypothetical protein
VRLCEVEVVSVRREPLSAVTADDVAAEGFPDWTPDEFVAFYCAHMRCEPSTVVTRIQWAYPDTTPDPGEAALRGKGADW